MSNLMLASKMFLIVATFVYGATAALMKKSDLYARYSIVCMATCCSIATVIVSSAEAKYFLDIALIYILCSVGGALAIVSSKTSQKKVLKNNQQCN